MRTKTAHTAPPHESERKQAADERLRPMRLAWGREWGRLVAQVAAQRRKGQKG